MTHDDAIASGASERYLLDELSGVACDAFEEHYFSCDVCAADVQSGAAFTASVRAAAREENSFAARVAKRGRRSWTPPLAIAASVLAAFVAYQQFFIIAPLRQPRLLHTLMLRAARGDENVVESGGGPFVISFDILPDSPPPPYVCTVVDARGVARISQTVTAEQARQGIELLVPAGKLAAGNYTLHVAGAGGANVLTSPFTVH